ncbi:MAG: methionine adenosyltransferase [Rickettsiales bacterium TMED289]|nr:MAG: methionine adenosyltransferase [Rickettsiales bacterium TMED289]|tara:strand:+ start:323 stop:1579 length:1257 start_codon:yes stop_codon:yes gene_type:complete
MGYLFTSESVSEGHPDKVADQISDAILDNFLAFDPAAKVACETLVTTGQVILSGEVKSNIYVDVQKVTRETIKKIGYTKSEYKFDYQSCGILSMIHDQSDDINRGVDKKNIVDQGAGDQGIMFGYAINETKDYMPLALDLSNKILQELAILRRENNEIKYLRPDSKSQITIEYSDDHKPIRIKTILISTQHDDFDNEEEMLERIKNDIREILIPRLLHKNPDFKYLFSDEIKFLVNPTGKFVIGGPHGDTGLTGRKIIVDTYGGKGSHGGGAFSGKDPSKVDRSGAYAARHIAKNIVAAGVCDEALVQISYAIGIAEPVSMYVDTCGTSKVNVEDGEISELLLNLFDLKPFSIEKRFDLRKPIYQETAAYGHVGRNPRKIIKNFVSSDGKKINLELNLFSWEKLDYVEKIKKLFKFAK